MYPHPLSERERSWIDWILPADRPGYKRYHDTIQSMTVIGEGRRGVGEMILGYSLQELNFSAPLPPVFAYGVIETNSGRISLTMREIMDDQISMEIVSDSADDVPDEFEEFRRWTYSTWSPGKLCPQCNTAVREVSMHTVSAKKEHVVLALCKLDKRVWVYHDSDKVNRLIPVTNYYNELMLHKNIRDPKIALDAQRLFIDLDTFSDNDFTYAFLTYNKLRTKIRFEGAVTLNQGEHTTFVQRLRRMFSRR